MSVFAATVLTLYPDAFPGVLGVSLLGKALAEKRWSLDTVDIRTFGDGPHRKVDDAPAGGGAGLVLRADVAAAAIDAVRAGTAGFQPALSAPNAKRGRLEAGGPDLRPLIYPSPRGAPLTQAMVRSWAQGPGLIVFCGRFEGLDERVIAGRQMQEVCVGDAVLMGGEVAAQLILEATVRLLPGVLGNDASSTEESFEDGLLEHPQFTKPRLWEGATIPDILVSGDHAKVAAWRRAERERVTRARRPDLWDKLKE